MSAALRERLQARRPEIEQEVLSRVYAVEDPTGGGDADYVQGLRAAVSAGLTYGLAALEGENRSLAIPHELLSQAREAARNGVSLDTVLRRYLVGYTLLGDFVMQEVEAGEPLGAEELKRLRRSQAELFDRVLVAVASEYRREAEARSPSPERRRAEQVERLLAGDLTQTDHLAYELEGWHIAAIAIGPEAECQLQSLAADLDRRVLLLPRGGERVWAWLGGRRRIESDDLLQAAAAHGYGTLSLAVGEPGEGLGGWRLSHRQAQAVLPVLARGPRRRARYADVALLASMIGDEVLMRSLRQIYLAPLRAERDGGAILRTTLRAYYAAERQVSSTATALGVSRNTVAARLKAIEELLGRPLRSCAAEVEAALRLEELEGRHNP